MARRVGGGGESNMRPLKQKVRQKGNPSADIARQSRRGGQTCNPLGRACGKNANPPAKSLLPSGLWMESRGYWGHPLGWSKTRVL